VGRFLTQQELETYWRKNYGFKALCALLEIELKCIVLLVTREHCRVSVFKPKYGRQLLKRDTKQVAQEDLGSLNDYQGSDS
jgi:hypothetical protein